MPDHQVDLNSRTQGVFFIPKKRKRPTAASSSISAAAASTSANPERLTDEDKDEAKMRRDLYERSWGRCLRRINAALDRLSSRTLAALTTYIESSQSNASASLFPTIPTALLTSPSESTSSSITSSLLSSLASANAGPSSSRRRTAFIECRPNTSLDSLIKATVLGLLETEAPDHPPTLPHLLPNLPSPSPPLFITLHQIHLLPSAILPSFIHVLARYATSLPFTLLFTTSTASGVFSEVIPSDILSRLDVKVFECAGGTEVWEAVVRSVFFSLDYEPDVLIDGDTLEELWVGYDRIDGSLETLISSIQYIYLRAYTLPLGIFIDPHHPSSPSSSSSRPHLTISSHLYKSLLSVSSLLQHPDQPLSLIHSAIDPSNLSVNDFPLPTPTDILDAVDQSRKRTHEHSRGLRLAYLLLMEIRGFLKERKNGGLMHADFDGDGGAASGSGRGQALLGANERVRAMRDCLMGESGIGRAAGELGWRWNVKLVSKLNSTELAHLKRRMSNILATAPSLSEADQPLSDGLEKDADDGTGKSAGSQLASLLEEFFDRRFVRPKQIVFHEIFYFQSLDDLVKVFRPSPLEALQTALLTPHVYLGCPCCAISSSTYTPSSLPDISILFARYLESGKLINLYDWFESFATVVEGRGRKRIRRDADGNVEETEGEEEEGEEKEEGEDEEKRKEEEKQRQIIQARFMRSFHELDLLGFLKGTKRREECCLKTFFLLTDEDADGMI